MTPTTVYARTKGDKFNTDAVLVAVTCATCHILYAIPTSLKRAALAYPGESSNGWKLCCPLGHTWWYTGESVEDKLQAAKDDARWYRDRMKAEADLRKDTERRLSAQKGATTKAKRRHAAGVCPVCSRTFQQVQRHMASQHPDYDPAKD